MKIESVLMFHNDEQLLTSKGMLEKEDWSESKERFLSELEKIRDRVFEHFTQLYEEQKKKLEETYSVRLTLKENQFLIAQKIEQEEAEHIKEFGGIRRLAEEVEDVLLDNKSVDTADLLKYNSVSTDTLTLIKYVNVDTQSTPQVKSQANKQIQTTVKTKNAETQADNLEDMVNADFIGFMKKQARITPLCIGMQLTEEYQDFYESTRSTLRALLLKKHEVGENDCNVVIDYFQVNLKSFQGITRELESQISHLKTQLLNVNCELAQCKAINQLNNIHILVLSKSSSGQNSDNNNNNNNPQTFYSSNHSTIIKSNRNSKNSSANNTPRNISVDSFSAAVLPSPNIRMSQFSFPNNKGDTKNQDSSSPATISFIKQPEEVKVAEKIRDQEIISLKVINKFVGATEENGTGQSIEVNKISHKKQVSSIMKQGLEVKLQEMSQTNANTQRDSEECQENNEVEGDNDDQDDIIDCDEDSQNSDSSEDDNIDDCVNQQMDIKKQQQVPKLSIGCFGVDLEKKQRNNDDQNENKDIVLFPLKSNQNNTSNSPRLLLSLHSGQSISVKSDNKLEDSLGSIEIQRSISNTQTKRRTSLMAQLVASARTLSFQADSVNQQEKNLNIELISPINYGSRVNSTNSRNNNKNIFSNKISSASPCASKNPALNLKNTSDIENNPNISQSILMPLSQFLRVSNYVKPIQNLFNLLHVSQSSSKTTREAVCFIEKAIKIQRNQAQSNSAGNQNNNLTPRDAKSQDKNIQNVLKTLGGIMSDLIKFAKKNQTLSLPPFHTFSYEQFINRYGYGAATEGKFSKLITKCLSLKNTHPRIGLFSDLFTGTLEYIDYTFLVELLLNINEPQLFTSSQSLVDISWTKVYEHFLNYFSQVVELKKFQLYEQQLQQLRSKKVDSSKIVINGDEAVLFLMKVYAQETKYKHCSGYRDLFMAVDPLHTQILTLEGFLQMYQAVEYSDLSAMLNYQQKSVAQMKAIFQEEADLQLELPQLFKEVVTEYPIGMSFSRFCHLCMEYELFSPSKQAAFLEEQNTLPNQASLLEGLDQIRKRYVKAREYSLNIHQSIEGILAFQNGISKSPKESKDKSVFLRQFSTVKQALLSYQILEHASKGSVISWIAQMELIPKELVQVLIVNKSKK